MRAKRSVGVFGGTFDPVHLGHVRAAQEVLERLRLDRILFVPTGQPPHRRAPYATAAQRLAMVRLAIAGHPRFALTDLEIRRCGPAYTVDTLIELHRLHPQREWFLILGSDQLSQLHLWHQPQRIMELAHVVGISRPRETEAPLMLTRPRFPHHPLQRLSIQALDISSTQIRRRLRAGHSLATWVPPAVETYIRRHHLYL